VKDNGSIKTRHYMLPITINVYTSMYVHPVPSVSWELTMLPERCKHKSYFYRKEKSEKNSILPLQANNSLKKKLVLEVRIINTVMLHVSNHHGQQSLFHRFRCRLFCTLDC
jgi:hypothetical protein